MNKKYLLLTVALLSHQAVIAQAPPAQGSSQNPTISQYQAQVNAAQTAAAANVVKNYYPQAQATSFGDTVTVLNYIAGGVNAMVTYAFNTLTKIFYQPTYNVATSMAVGNTQTSAIGITDNSAKSLGINPYPTDATPNASTLSGQAIYNTLSSTIPGDVYSVFSNQSLIPVTMYSQPSCLDVTAVLKFGGNCYSPSNTPQIYTSNLNMNSLLGPFQVSQATTGNLPQYSFAYPTGQAQLAQNYIQYAGGLAQPLAVLDLSKCTDNTCLSNPAIQQYIATIRTYAAQQSAGISALYRLMMERSVVMDPTSNQPLPLGQLAGMPNNSPNYPGASPLQIDEYSATRRLADPNWYATMESSQPITIQRENLYVNAETRLELFKLRMAVENLTAVMAVMQLQQLRATQSQLTDTINNQVKGIIGSVPPYKKSS